MDTRPGATPVDLLRWAESCLTHVVESPRLEAELLLAHSTGWTRAQLYARSKEIIGGDLVTFLESMVRRRQGHEPLQYIIGGQSFRGFEIAVGPGVLVPRPETELVVEIALKKLGSKEFPNVIDVGAGSGAIAIAISLERPDSSVFATEISPEASVWCRKNLEAHSASHVQLFEGDLFDPLPTYLHATVDLVVSNPPYLSDAELRAAPRDVSDHEPKRATVAGPSGLEVVSKVVDGAVEWLVPGGWLVLETHPGQSVRLLALMTALYEEVEILPDLSGKDRVAVGRTKESH